jgi:hypothetical protein
MIALSLLTFLGIAQAETIDFYVAPTIVENHTRNKEIEQDIDVQLAFAISSSYKESFKVIKNNRHMSAREAFDEIRVFNNETIKYYSDCDYEKEPMKCSFGNNYYVETVVTVDDNQLIVRMTMYDPNLQVVSNGYSTEDMIVNWIKQQEVTYIQQTAQDGTKTDLTHYGLERLPLKWEIPHHLLEKHIRQATVGCWLGIKIRI